MVFTFIVLANSCLVFISLSKYETYRSLNPSISLTLLFKKWISQQYEVLQVSRKNFIPTFCKKICALSFSLYSIFQSTVVCLRTLFVQYLFLTYEILIVLILFAIRIWPCSFD